MATLISVIVIGIALIGGAYFLLLYRRFKEKAGMLSHEEIAIKRARDRVEVYVWFCAVLILYGVSVWLFSLIHCDHCEGNSELPLVWCLLLSIIAAPTTLGVLFLIGTVLQELYEKIAKSLSCIITANQSIDQKKAEEKQKQQSKK